MPSFRSSFHLFDSEDANETYDPIDCYYNLAVATERRDLFAQTLKPLLAANLINEVAFPLLARPNLMDKLG